MGAASIARKNWLFVGSKPAGRRAARHMSLIASCKDNRVEPFAYLRDIFKQRFDSVMDCIDRIDEPS